ncbi:MAG: metallophosphoesterase [Clostridia bacterium]|nr:metallophosphoesterase [Clostridia bacterium]
MRTEKLKFNKNGKFIIMQVSDAQDLQFVRHTMVRMLNKAYDTVCPDLVVFTGDNILGNHLRDARFGSKHVIHTKEEEYEKMKKAISHICRPLEQRQIPFTMIYGNHDDMNEITKEEQADIYRSYKMCRGLDNPDKTVDVDTFDLPVYSSDASKKVFNLWMIDSAWCDKEADRCHTGVTKETVEWYKRRADELKEENGGKYLPSIMFQHIPMPETMNLLSECDKDTPGAILHRMEDGQEKYFILDPKKADGYLCEPVTPYDENNGQLEALREKGDVKAVVYGHDHSNNFIGEHDGVTVIQSSAASFRCYGNHLRGVRIFELDENAPEEFRTYFLTYSDICGNGIGSKIAYIWDADGCIRQKTALIAGAAAAGVATGALIYYLRRKSNG